ncbi:MAG: hypothetical protein JW745_08940 [Sedimentisphaerales bacterium]|nr:hypothetical protein [Sedimentisphaerales bacterium]MBN2841497.1 hypothetical protein [Sedimentisphaerales bacterium]
MAIIIGIDEAGYGPLLGPLVVSSAAFSLPDDKLSQSLWQLLETGVALAKTGSKGRVIINDSKKLHNTVGDYSLLARSVIATRAAATDSAAQMYFPATIRDYLDSLKYDNFKQFNDYPWYAQMLDANICYDRSDTAIAASCLWRALKKASVSLEYIKTTPLDVMDYNQQVELTGNKAVVLFNLACQHIYYAWERFGYDKLNIIVDKQGGRANYRDKLQKLFPYARLNELKQTPQLSSYHIIEGDKAMKIHFIAKGDQKQLPVALASMASKLTRELLIEQLNTYFQRIIPELKPTAGYYQDGNRFLNDLRLAGQYPPPAIEKRLVRIK